MNLLYRIICFFTLVYFPADVFTQGVGERNVAHTAMVATEHARASEVGEQILRKGGNAVDAAVAVGFALAVVYPEAGNIGGGGFMVIRFPDGSATSIDYRETAPAYAHPDVYIDDNGVLQREWSLVGARAAGVPGSVAGLLIAWERYGSLPLADIINPSIKLADEGFILQTRDIRTINSYLPSLIEFPESKEIFIPDGIRYQTGDLFRQADLARTLERIRDHGRDGFYRGETADRIVDTMKKYDGWITYDDLENYRAIEREPLRSVYRGHEIITMGPPSSGGVALVQILQMLEHADLAGYNHGSTNYVHLITEVMKRAFADRNAYIGDPDFVDIPVDMLISPEYARDRFESIEPGKATGPGDIGVTTGEETETTHYSIIDEEGMAVSVTTTVNSLFGSKLTVGGAGFLLNNQMNDFALQPGIRDQFGLLASTANKIEPGKRMISSMIPTIVVRNDEPVLMLGARGRPRIISAVFQVITNIVDYGMSLETAVNTPFFHHQWQPDRLEYRSNTLSFRQRWRLRSMGHTPILRRLSGRIVAIAQSDNGLTGVSSLYTGGGIRGY